jgi:hypothetical protein
MPTTSNFGWTTPADTDLVKDGAAAIRTLGNGIDTSLVDLKGGTTGQVLSKTSNTDMDFTWVTTDDANAIQNTIVDAKGDLISATGSDVPARLAVGNNGESLVADSSATTGLRWQGNYAAGKNLLLNGDFSINQRQFTSTTSDAVFTFDRYKTATTGGTSTFTSQTFTPGAAPVAGYEAKNYIQLDSTGQSAAGDRTFIRNIMESARLLAGRTYTVSFWAKASSGTPSIALEPFVSFGTGGSPSSALDGATLGNYKTALTTSWARYSATFTMPSVSGKTFGTNNDDSTSMIFWTSAGSTYNARTNTLGLQTTTIQLWGIQVEIGNVATAFQTATGTLAGELAACQRYYFQTATLANKMFTTGQAYSTTQAYGVYNLPVTMRGTPSVTFSAAGDFDLFNAIGSRLAVTALSGAALNVDSIRLDATVASGLVAGNAAVYIDDAGGNASIRVSAEL